MLNKATVVIPVYNNEIELARAIKSVLSQTIQDFELIIVDDGSSDCSYSIINSIKDKRIKYFKQQHSGASKARNFGVSKAQSDFIAFLDADDEWRNIFLETVLYLRDKFPQAGLYFTNYSYNTYNSKINSNNIINEENINEKEHIIKNYFKYVLTNEPFNNIITSCVAIKKIIFEELNGFDVNATWGEDQDLWARVALKYSIVHSKTTGAIIHHRLDASDYNRYLPRVLERIKKTNQHPFILSGKKALRNNNIPDFIKNDLKEVIAFYQILSSSYNLLAGNFVISKKILNECDTLKYNKQKRYQLLYTKIPKPFDQIFGKKIYRIIHFSQNINLRLKK